MSTDDILFHEVYGCSWKGRETKRDGKYVRCGHQHSTEDDARPCLERMRTEKPGKCQDYRILQLMVEYRKFKHE